MESTYIPTNREMLNKSHYFHSMEFHTVLKELQSSENYMGMCMYIHTAFRAWGVQLEDSSFCPGYATLCKSRDSFNPHVL